MGRGRLGGKFGSSNPRAVLLISSQELRLSESRGQTSMEMQGRSLGKAVGGNPQLDHPPLNEVKIKE